MARDWVRFFIFSFFGAGGGFGFVFSFFPSPLSGLLVVGVRHPGFRFAPPVGYDPTPLRGLKAPTFCLSHFAYHVEVPTVGRLGEEVSQ